MEHDEVLARGLGRAERRAVVRFIEAGTGAVVALRSDVTPQIARMVATRVGPRLAPDTVLRLGYAADVVRQPSGPRGRTELHQAGVELIGDPRPGADAELLAMCAEALVDVGLPAFRFESSHRGLARALVDALGLRDEAHDALLERLARKDRRGVEAVLPEAEVDASRGLGAGGSAELHGSPAVVTAARQALRGTPAEAGLDELEAVLAALAQHDPPSAATLGVDLGEVRGFDYYTGLRMRVWARGSATPVVRGGRYDATLARYGTPAPATGFAIDLDALESALDRAALGPVGRVRRVGRWWSQRPDPRPSRARRWPRPGGGEPKASRRSCCGWRTRPSSTRRSWPKSGRRAVEHRRDDDGAQRADGMTIRRLRRATDGWHEPRRPGRGRRAK